MKVGRTKGGGTEPKTTNNGVREEKTLFENTRGPKKNMRPPIRKKT